MRENHEREQYFFDAPTLAHLTAFVSKFAAPCCVCAPFLGRRLSEEGVSVTILDIDERFADLPGFMRYDIRKPVWLDQTFDLIVCDPPFFDVSLSQLFSALRTVSHNDFRQPLLISYLTRRESALLGIFAPFSLRSTGYRPKYETVRDDPKNEIEFYGNLDVSDSERLAGRIDGKTMP